MPNVARIFAALLIALASTAAQAAAKVALTTGQTVYVPVYSSIFVRDRPLLFHLAITLTIWNTDPKYPMTVVLANYFDQDGKLVKTFVPEPIKLQPLASTTIFVQEQDTAGGVGASFLVQWKAARAINVPVIEAVMIGARSGQGISFVSPGRAIREESEP